jgi:hypothetical protein
VTLESGTRLGPYEVLAPLGEAWVYSYNRRLSELSIVEGPD